ncbi:MAG: BlaI/MecI/CopY family transcriptional regulator, partial [Bryobacteraceae bacterium]
ATVRQVREALAPRHNLAYTTVLTVLDRLARKGVVERRLSGRRFVYRATLSRDEARRAALRDLVENYFDGSTAELLAFLGAATPRPESAAPATAGLDTVLL